MKNMQVNKQKKQKGFGLLEVLIAFIVLGLMMVVINRIQQTNRWQLAYNDSRATALQIAQRVFDSLQVAGIGIIPGDSSVNTIDCTMPDQARDFECDITGYDLGKIDDHVYSKRIKVEVKWKIFEKEHHVEMNGVVE